MEYWKIPLVGVGYMKMSNKAHLMTGYGQTRQAFDFYPTPRSSVEALLQSEIFSGSILEPASGQGHISKVLSEYYPDTDIYEKWGKPTCFSRWIGRVAGNPPLTYICHYDTIKDIGVIYV